MLKPVKISQPLFWISFLLITLEVALTCGMASLRPRPGALYQQADAVSTLVLGLPRRLGTGLACSSCSVNPLNGCTLSPPTLQLTSPPLLASYLPDDPLVHSRGVAAQ